MSDVKITNNTILLMLSAVFLEIRAGDNPNYSKVIADIFHNVPVRIIRKVDPQEIYDDMLRVAERHGVAEYLTRVYERAVNDDLSTLGE